MGDFRVRVQNDSTLLIEVVGAVASDMKCKDRNEKEKKRELLKRKKKKRVRSTKDKENETRFTLVMIGGGYKGGPFFRVDNGLLFLLRCCATFIITSLCLPLLHN